MPLVILLAIVIGIPTYWISSVTGLSGGQSLVVLFFIVTSIIYAYKLRADEKRRNQQIAYEFRAAEDRKNQEIAEKIKINEKMERDEQIKKYLEINGEKLIDEHLPALVRRYRQLVRTDDYGLVDKSSWEIERNHFFQNVVLPRLPERTYWREWQSHFENEMLDPKVQFAFEKQRESFADRFDPDIAPTDYEHLCAERLRQLGWDAKVTKAGGDQGADVIASKDGNVMVVQCKRYSKPVGNKAIQEIVGALRFYDAQYALVIASNGYTKAARALADVNDVMLIHHDDLTAGWLPSSLN